MKYIEVSELYKKFPDLKEEDAKKLLEWTIKQPHLPNLKELEILIFLHGCYYRIESTKLLIDLYHTVRTHSPEFFANRNVLTDSMRTAMSTFVITPLPGLTTEGYKCMYVKVQDSRLASFNFADAVKLSGFVNDIWMMEEGVAEGHILIINMDGFVLGHVGKIGITLLKKFLTFMQDALPVRIKGFHFINTVPFMDTFLGLMRPFMKKKLLDIMQLHQTMDTVYEFIPKEMLPNECGGNGGTHEELQKKIYDKVLENPEFFLEEEKTRRVNERLRPGKPKNAGEIFGVDGNFKKLDID